GPVFAAIVGAVQAAFFGFNQGITAIGVCAGDRDANASHDSPGQAVTFKALPCGPAIGGFVETAARPAAIEAPGSAIDLPQGSKERVGVVRIKNYVDSAGLVVFEQHLLPGGAAIGGAKQAAFFIRPISMAQGRNKNDVGVLGIDDHRADV